MTDQSRFSEAGDDSGTVYERGSPTGIPRWVKVAGILVAIVVLVAVIMAFLLPGDDGDGHSPRRHSLGSPDTPPAPVAAAVRVV